MKCDDNKNKLITEKKNSMLKVCIYMSYVFLCLVLKMICYQLTLIITLIV